MIEQSKQNRWETVGQRRSKETVQFLWMQYRRNGGDVTARNQLIEHYLPMVKFHADRIAFRTHGRLGGDELMAAGVFGLMDSIESFDFDRGIKFETFAGHRVRGAMLDELRSRDWVPRLVRSRTSKVEQARCSFIARQGREPADVEIAQSLGVDDVEYRKISRDSQVVGLVSLQQKMVGNRESTDRDLTAARSLADPTQAEPFMAAQTQELRELVLEDLQRVERLLIQLYYYEGMTMKEISLTFDISESRVCQLHSQILTKIRTQLRRHQLAPVEPVLESVA